MGSFFAYTLYSGLFLLLFYLLYRIFLSGEKQIALNRAVLLGCYVVSFLAWPIDQTEWTLQSTGMTVDHSSVMELGVLTLNPVAATPGDSSVLPAIRLWIYLAGAAGVLLKTLFSTARLLMYIRKGELVRMNGYTLVVMHGEDTPPCSFGRYVVMNDVDYEAVGEAVTAHELAHIRCRHYLDLLLSQTVCVLLWYNPASWLMRDELKLLHEYQADAAVIDGGADETEYQMLLIRKTVGHRFHSLANNLNHSKLKNRIAMMQKENSSGLSRLRLALLAIAPVVAIGVVNIPAVASGLNTLESSSLDIPSSGMSSVEIDAASAESNASQTVVAAEYPGGPESLMRFLAENLRYPQDARSNDVQGRVTVGFTVAADGTVSDVRMLRGAESGLDAEAMRVVRKMPKWSAATIGGTPVAARYALPVRFGLNGVDGKEDSTSPLSVGDNVNLLEEVVVVAFSKPKKESAATTLDVSNQNVKLAVGPCDDPDHKKTSQAFMVNGKLLEKGMDINTDDIESMEVLPGGDEYPDGIVSIKLKPSSVNKTAAKSKKGVKGKRTARNKHAVNRKVAQSREAMQRKRIAIRTKMAKKREAAKARRAVQRQMAQKKREAKKQQTLKKQKSKQKQRTEKKQQIVIV